ncbi:hypothetical protein BgiMline_032352 [Biomphalaria glabrata]
MLGTCPRVLKVCEALPYTVYKGVICPVQTNSVKENPQRCKHDRIRQKSTEIVQSVSKNAGYLAAENIDVFVTFEAAALQHGGSYLSENAVPCVASSGENAARGTPALLFFKTGRPRIQSA